MNVDDPVRIRLYHLRRNRHKAPRKNYKIRSGSLKCRKKRIVKFLSGCEILRRKDLGRDPCLLRPLERIHARVVGNHTDNLCSVNASIRNPVNDCLQVCAAA